MFFNSEGIFQSDLKVNGPFIQVESDIADAGLLYFGSVMGGVDGDNSAGLKNNAGTMQVKNKAGNWVNIGTGTGHNQLHAMTSTADHSAGNWKVFYSDGSGHVQELTCGSAGQVLIANGATSAPSWSTFSGGTDELVKVGSTGTADYLNSSYFQQDGTNHIRLLTTTVLTGVNADLLDGQHAPTGNIVGDSDSQTLTNKTLTSPAIGNFSNATHAHSSTSTGGTVDHTSLSSVGINTHAQIDTALTRLVNTSGSNTGDQSLAGLGGVPTTTTVNGHALSGNISVTASDVGLSNVTNVEQLPVSYLDTDTSLAANSDTKVPSQKAIKTYADGLVVGLLDYRGGYDASGNTYPSTGGSGTAGAILKGDMWVVSVAGTLGSVAIQVGDSIIANTDTPGQTATNWNSLNVNISYVPEDQANKVTSITGSSTNTQYPSAKLLYDQLALKLPYTVATDNDTWSGFVNPDSINVSYSYTNRTITLTGTLDYYYQGVKKTLTSPWTPPTAHTNATGTYYLYSTDGVTFSWSTTVWDFKAIMVALVSRGASAATSHAVREVHGTMDWMAHQDFHSNIGTWRLNGGQLTASSYTENTATDVATTPGFDAATIRDEDLSTSIGVWAKGTYTTMYIGASSVSTYNSAATFPFISTGSYIQVNNVSTGAMTNGVNARYYNVYQILVPTTSDSDSQKYRMVMIQPQNTFTSLATAQAEDVRTLTLGDFASLEYVIYARITYVTATGDTNTGKCRIATGGITYNIGNRAASASVAGLVVNNHAVLSNLSWTSSAHTGTAYNIPAFDSLGSATEISPGSSGNLLISNGTSWASTAVPTWNQSTTGSAANVPASGLTGTTLAAGVVSSSLTSVGTLTGLSLSGVARINLNASALPTDIAGTSLQISQADATINYLLLDGTGAAPLFATRRSQGTGSSRSNVTNNNPIGGIRAWGYGATGYSSSYMGAMQITTNESWTDTAQGTRIDFLTTAKGTTTVSTPLSVNSESVVIGNILRYGGTTPTNTWSGALIPLVEYADGTNQGTLYTQNNNPVIGLGSNMYYNAGYKMRYTNSYGASSIIANPGYLSFCTWGAGSADSALTAGEAMRILSTGKVGIGRVDPQVALDVVGTGYFSSSLILKTPTAQQKTWHSAVTPLQIGMLGSMMAYNGVSTDAWMNISRNMYVNSSGLSTYMYGTSAVSLELGTAGVTISVAPVGTADTSITWTPALKVNMDTTMSVAKLTTSQRTGISSPITGSMVYDSDLNLFYYYNGASWTSFGTGTGHSQLHSMTSTADHSAGNWKVFYSDGSGHVIELGMGSSGQVLQSNGASAAPTWVTPSTGSGGGYTVVSKTGNYSAATTDQVILCDTSGGAFTITLPAVATSSGVNYRIIKTDSSTNAVTIQGNASETINGSNTQVFNTQYDSVQVVCSGSAWFIM